MFLIPFFRFYIYLSLSVVTFSPRAKFYLCNK